MDEARRFLRYILPGLLFAIEVVLLLLLLRPDLALAQLTAVKDAEGLGLVLAALVASGGLGFFLSTLHHTFHWWPWTPRPKAVDHSTVIENLVKARILSIRRVDGKEFNATALTREQAWMILSGLWHPRSNSSESIKGADKAAAALADMVHSTGTARVAAFAAPIVAFGVAISASSFSEEPAAIVRFVVALARRSA